MAFWELWRERWGEVVLDELVRTGPGSLLLLLRADLPLQGARCIPVWTLVRGDGTRRLFWSDGDGTAGMTFGGLRSETRTWRSRMMTA